MVSHWLDRYGTGFHAWREGRESGGTRCLYRPLGIIESAFDSDGVYFEGRADINVAFDLAVSSSLSREQLRKRILYAWTSLRLRHGLLMTKTLDKQSYMQSEDTGRYFVVVPPTGVESALQDAKKQLVFTDDFYKSVDANDFYRHAQNTARVIEPEVAMSKLFVLPLEKMEGSRAKLSFLFVIGHHISDALTNYTWLQHFLSLLNLPMQELAKKLEYSLDLGLIQKGLPTAQEDLYPPIVGNVARQRWFWAITRILRHVRKRNPSAFANPLRRDKPREQAQAYPPTYSSLLDYSRVPPLNTFVIEGKLSKTAAARLHTLCKEAGASVGAGYFTLIALLMMETHEQRFPGVSPDKREAYVVGFPINPRSFYNHAEAPNSLMLVFCDGFALPFLSSTLDREKRFKVLVKQSHRHLAMYQKRPRKDVVDMKAYMGTRGAGRVIGISYVSSMERKWQKLPKELQQSGTFRDPQGLYNVPPHPTNATNGVSSLGRLIWPAEGAAVHSGAGEDAFRAVYRDSKSAVRVRDGEFLVAVWGDTDGTASINVSCDANAIDEGLAQEWRRRLEAFFDKPHSQRGQQHL